MGARYSTDGCSATVLLMISMQDQQQIKGVDDDRIRLILPGRYRKHHLQEIGAVRQRVFRIHERLTNGFLLGESRQRANLGHQSYRVYIRIFTLIP